MASANVATLSLLPSDVVGIIFSLLPDPASKRAFFASSKLVHDAKSVGCQLTKRTVTPEELHTCSLTYSPLSAVPRGASIKQLVVLGHCASKRHNGTHERPPTTDCEKLLMLLNPEQADGQARSKVQQVLYNLEEITLEGCICGRGAAVVDHTGAHTAALLGHALSTLPQLKVLRISPGVNHSWFYSSFPALGLCAFHSFFEALSSRNIKEIHVLEHRLSLAALKAICRRTGLEALSFRGAGTFYLPESISSLSSLKSLRKLCVEDESHCSANNCSPDARKTYATLTNLEVMRLHSIVDAQELISSLPSSVTRLEFVRIWCLESLHDIFHTIALARPRIHHLCIDKLEVSAWDLRHHGSLEHVLSAMPLGFQYDVSSFWVEEAELHEVLTFFCQWPSLASRLKAFDMICPPGSSVAPASSFAELASRCPSLKEVSVEARLCEDLVACVLELARRLKLRKLGVDFCIPEFLGYQSILLTLCALLAMCPGPEPLAPLLVDVHLMFMGSDEDGDNLEEEIRVLKQSWQKLSTEVLKPLREVLLKIELSQL